MAGINSYEQILDIQQLAAENFCKKTIKVQNVFYRLHTENTVKKKQSNNKTTKINTPTSQQANKTTQKHGQLYRKS